MIDLPEPHEKVLGQLQAQDVFHVALHLLIVLACFPVALDPLTAGLMSVLAVEGQQAWDKRRFPLGDLRDTLFRGIGVAIGVLVGLLFGQIPTF